jgi:hypothetical protein
MNGEERKHLVLQLDQWDISVASDTPQIVMDVIDAAMRSKGEAGEWKERKDVDIMIYRCHKHNRCSPLTRMPLLFDAICALGYELAGCYGDRCPMFRPVKKTNEFTK